MSFIKKLVAAVTSALLLVSPASAATKYVATSGSTSWSAGATVGDPITLATFNTNAVAGDVAILANGTYTSAINPQHGGTGYAPTARITYVGNLASPSSVYVTGVTLGYGYATVKGVQHGGNLNISSPGDSVYSVLATAGVPRVSLGGDGANISNSTFTGEQMEFSGGTNGASPSMVTNDTLSDCTFNLNQAGSGYSQAALRVYTTSGLQFNRCRFFINIGANGNHGTWKMYGGRYGKFTDCMFDYTSSRNTTSSGCDECNTSYFRDYTMFNLFQRDTFNLHSQYMMTFMPEASGSFPNSTQGNRYDQCVFRYDGAVVTDHYSALLWYQDGMRSDTLTNCVVVSSTQPCVDLELVGSNCVVKNNTFVRMAAGPAVVVNNTWSGSPQVKRNIFYSSGGGATGSTGAAVSGGNYTAYWALADSNLYYCTNPATSALWLGSGYGVGAGRTACTGFSAECHSAYGDPLFVGGDDPGTFDAHIGSTSPAIALGAGAYSYSTAAIGNPSNLIASYYYNSTPGVAVIYTAASTLGSGTTGVDSIKYATSPITTSAAFSTASNWATKTITDSLGASVGRRANGLDWGTTYYFAVRTTNNLGEQSDILSDTLSTPTYPVVGPPTSFVVSQNLGSAIVPRISYSYSLTTTLGLGSTATDSLKLSTSPITNQATFSAASNWTTVNSSAHDGSTKTGTKLTGLSWSTLYYAAIKTTNNLGTSSTIVTDTVMTVAPYLPDTIDYFTAQPEAGVVPAIKLSGDLPPTAVVGGTGTTGTLYVKYSTSPITSDALFSAATTLITVPNLSDTDGSGSIADYMDSPVFTVPAWATTYYVAARLIDDTGAMGVMAADTARTPATPASVSVSGVSVAAKANIHSITVRAYVSGDVDTNAVLTIFYKVLGSASYDSGMVMSRRPGTKVYVGKILWLNPSQSVSYYVDVYDPSHGATSSDTATVVTMRQTSFTGSTNIYYVSNSGSDGNSGTDAAHPFATIGAAATALSSKSGGAIYLLGPGKWYESTVLNWGTPTSSAHYSLIGVGNPDSIIIDGSYKPALDGYVDGTHALSWASTGVDSIYKCYYPHHDSLRVVVLGWSELVHRKLSMAELIGDAMGERSGWWWQNDTLYLQRANGQTPAGQVLHIGHRNTALRVLRRHWLISNLTIRFFGNYGILLGDFGRANAASGTAISNTRIYGCGGAAIYGTTNSDSISISNNILSGLTIGAMSYQASKSRGQETANTILLGGGNWNIEANLLRQMFDGIAAGATADSLASSESDILDNTIMDCQDDAWQADGSYDIGLLYARNNSYRNGTGASIAPVVVGPTYVLYNTIWNNRKEGIRLGSASEGQVLIAHNTIGCSGGTAPAIWNPGGAHKRTVFRNNIFQSSTSGGAVVYNPVTGADTSGTYTNDFNYNCYDSLGTGGRLVEWKSGVRYSLASLRVNAAGFRWETAGIQAAPVFRDTAALDFATTSTTLRDAGVRLTGINTRVMYDGTSPDIGRYAYQAVNVTPSTPSNKRLPWWKRLVNPHWR